MTKLPNLRVLIYTALIRTGQGATTWGSEATLATSICRRLGRVRIPCDAADGFAGTGG